MNFNVFGDPKCQPTIVFVNGSIMRSDQWATFIPTMNELGFAVVTFNFPGQGESNDCKIDPSIETLADYLDEVVANIDASKVYILGISMGANIGLYYACTRPDRVKGFISLGGSSEHGPRSKFLATALADALDKGGLPYLFDFLNCFNFSEEWLEENRIRLKLSRKDCASNNNIPTVRALVTLPTHASSNFSEKLSGFQGHCLLMLGENDPFFSINSQEKMQGKLANSSIKIIEGAAHAFIFEKPDLTLTIIKDFLSKVEQTQHDPTHTTPNS